MPTSSDPPWVVPFVKAIVLSPDRRTFLLQHRTKRGDLYDGFWELPGGRVQVGESLHECLEREVKEEAGLAILEILGQRLERIVDRLGGTARLVRPLVTVEVEEHSIFGHYFACVAEPDATPRSCAECDGHYWITPTAFRQTFLDGPPPELGAGSEGAHREGGNRELIHREHANREDSHHERSNREHTNREGNDREHNDRTEMPDLVECSTVDLLALRVAFSEGLDRFFQP